jgi:hypothetical protein
MPAPLTWHEKLKSYQILLVLYCYCHNSRDRQLYTPPPETNAGYAPARHSITLESLKNRILPSQYCNIQLGTCESHFLS